MTYFKVPVILRRGAPFELRVFRPRRRCATVPDTEREYPLTGRAKKARDGETGRPPPATCSGCFMQLQRPCPDACAYCGAPLIIPRDLPKTTNGQFAEPKRAEVEARKRAKDAKAARTSAELAAKEKSERDPKRRACLRTLEDLEKLGKDRGHHPGWADKRWAVYGVPASAISTLKPPAVAR
jgi:hypothetical protein